MKDNRKRTAVSGLDEDFQHYFKALDAGSGGDRCYLCRRTASEVKSFFGFDEDGVPSQAEEYGIEDVVLDRADIMSYRGVRPICSVCQLNMDAIFLLGEHKTLHAILRQMEQDRDRLWPRSEGESV